MTDFEEGSVPVLNEIIRAGQVDTKDNTTDIATNVTAIAAINDNLVQSVYDETVTVITCNDQIPADDTAPLFASEGVTVVDAAITPVSATNTLRVSFTAWGTESAVGASVPIVAIFDGTTCVQVATGNYLGTAETVTFSTQVEYTAGAGARTITAKIGSSSAKTIYINGDNAGNRLFGGTSRATLIIDEIK